MTHDYKETLYINLFNILDELTEHETPEVIFDRIVEEFAMSAEHHMGKADTFSSMLNTFRHENPTETIPHTVSEDTEEPQSSMYDTEEPKPLAEAELLWDSILEQTDPRKRTLMSADSDAFKAFVDQMNFPG